MKTWNNNISASDPWTKYKYRVYPSFIAAHMDVVARYGGTEEVKWAKERFGEAVELKGKFPSLTYMLYSTGLLYYFL
jgi:hypothetical protein